MDLLKGIMTFINLEEMKILFNVVFKLMYGYNEGLRKVKCEQLLRFSFYRRVVIHKSSTT
mgnify:CR=1 FL=1